MRVPKKNFSEIMFQIDEISHLVTVSGDTLISSLEEKLNDQEFTLGFFHPPSNHFTIEEILAKKLFNLYSLSYGEVEELCVSLSIRKKNKSTLQTKITPRQSTGPSWKNFILGSDRELGTIHQAVFKIFPLPTQIVYSIVGFSSLEDSYLFERKLSRNELFPRCFGRFEKSRLGTNFSRFPKNFFLVLEWAYSRFMMKAALIQLDLFTDKKYFYQQINQEKDEKYFSKLLREKIPKIEWGGIQFSSSNKEVLKLKKELIKVLK